MTTRRQRQTHQPQHNIDNTQHKDNTEDDTTTTTQEQQNNHNKTKNNDNITPTPNKQGSVFYKKIRVVYFKFF